MSFTTEGMVRGKKYRIVFDVGLTLLREVTAEFIGINEDSAVFDLRPEHGTTPIRMVDVKEVYKVADDAALVPPHIYRGEVRVY
jgi:hypothetical protein